MNRNLPLFLVLAGIVAVGTFLFMAAPAAASCTGICENVAPPGEFCLRCMDAGEETGALCRDSGSCGCFYEQCPWVLQSSADVFVTPQDASEFLQQEPTVEKTTPRLQGGCDLIAQIFGERVDQPTD